MSKFGLYFVAEIIWVLYWLGTLITDYLEKFLQWTRTDKSKHKSFKRMPLHYWVDDPETK